MAVAAAARLRHGLSLLDQLIAFGAGKAGEVEARAMLGTVSRDHVVRIATSLGRGDTGELLRAAQQLEEFAPDYAQVLDELAALLVRVGLRQAVRDYAADERYAPEDIEQLAASLAPEDVQLFYQTAIIGRRDLALAPDAKSGFEMTLLRMIAFRPAGAPVSASAPASTVSSAANTRSESASGAAEDSGWSAIVSQLELTGAARQLASHCVYIGRQGAVVSLGLDPRNQLLRTATTEEKLAQALSRHFGTAVRLEFHAATVAGVETPAQAQRRASEAELAAARRAFEEDPGVKGLRERFGASVLPETVRPLK
jgi:DNA polymerase-3 subunit gamma/tau